jgi:hypothetical protein
MPRPLQPLEEASERQEIVRTDQSVGQEENLEAGLGHGSLIPMDWKGPRNRTARSILSPAFPVSVLAIVRG